MNFQEEVENLADKYPHLNLLDLHYLLMKYYGINDAATKLGRPTWNLVNNISLYHITFGSSEQESPYNINEFEIQFCGKSLPFRVDFVERIPVTIGRYYYFRRTDYMTPTLDDELIINLNFHRQCFTCKFCQFILYKVQPNISEEEGFNLIINGGFNDFKDVAEIAIVTGALGSEKKIFNHINKIIKLAVELGFRGRVFYMGFELIDPKLIKRLHSNISRLGLKNFRMAYTVEMFNDRKRLMRGNKSAGSLLEIIQILKSLRDEGLINLEYAYIPSFDTLDEFKRGAEKLSLLAIPHISIFRPWRNGQRNQQASTDYIDKGPQYLCEMRQFYETLYSKNIYGNNLGNLWPFPLNRINKLWVEGKIVGDSIGKRYWLNKIDPRITMIQIPNTNSSPQ